MTLNITLLLLMAVFIAGGIYLLLDKSLTRVLLAFLLLSNGGNIFLLLAGGYAGAAPLVVKGLPPEEYDDPLPQIFILTAIVIGFAVSAFMLGIIYRQWHSGQQDELERDTEDLAVAERAAFDTEEDADVDEETTEFTPEHEG